MTAERKRAKDDLVVIELTDEQRDAVAVRTGLMVRVIDVPRPALVALALAADAFRAGAKMNISSPVVVDLDEKQRTQVRDAVGFDAAALLFDPDAGQVGFHERWDDDLPAFPLGEKISVRWWDAREGGSGGPAGHPGPVEPGTVWLEPVADARGVFGTGLHPTTRIAARLLEHWIEPGVHAADLGCGSGILTFAALQLGAVDVFALDIEADAVEMARRNAALNGVVDRVTLTCRPLDAATDGPFDLVIANIFPNVLIRLAPDLATIVRPGGVLLVSGVIEARRADVAAALENQPFTTVEERVRMGWAGRALRRQ